MSVKHYNEETDQWEILASNRAMDIAIKDSSSNYESNNVEGALKEIGSLSKANDIKITELDGRVQYIEEHGVIGGGGSGGGGGGGTGSLPTITSQYDTEIVDANEDITIRIFFSSPNLGTGTCYVICNNVEILTVTVDQGYNDITIPALGSGLFDISMYVKDRAGLLSNTLSWNLTAGGLSVKLTMNTNIDYLPTDRILMTYNVDYSLNDSIIMYLTVDYTSHTVSCTKGYNSYNLTGLGVGIHKVSFYLKAGIYETQVQTFNVVVVNTDNLYVSTTNQTEMTVEEGEPCSINYRISKKSTENFDIKIFVDNNLVSQRTSGVGNYYYNNNTLPLGTHSIRIAVSSEDGESMSLDFVINIVAGDYIRRTIVTGGLIANWDASGLSNQDTHKKHQFYWGYKSLIICDAKSGLPIYEETCTADKSDVSSFIGFMKRANKSFSLVNSIVIADKGFDSKKNYNYIKNDLNGTAIIAKNKRNTKNSKSLAEGNLICQAGLAMHKDGKQYLKDSIKQKYRCPFAQSKDDSLCPCGHPRYFNNAIKRGCIKYKNIGTDYRSSVDETSMYFKNLYSKRTECERHNARLKNLNLEYVSVRNFDSVQNLYTLGHICLLSVAIAAKKQNLDSLMKSLVKFKRAL